MLDTTISKGNYAYQFRVDILETKQNTMVQLCKMLTQEEFKDWLCNLEIGTTTQKPHYQCIIWHSKILSQKDRNTYKAKYFRKNRDTKNSISFTDAKKIVNLSSYVRKDEDILDRITTLTEEQFDRIPEWLTKHAIKTKWNKELEDEILIIISENEYGHRPTLIDFASQIVKFYIDNHHPPPSRQQLYKLALKYHPSYTITDYLRNISFINEY